MSRHLKPAEGSWTEHVPVECWGQPRVPDTGAAVVDCILEPAL